MLVPLRYNLRSMFVRKTATALTVLGLGATVAVLAGVLALQQGFALLYTENGRDDLAVFLRPGATNEGDSLFRRDLGLQLIKTLPEIVRDPQGLPLASMEAYLAVRRFREGGDGRAETNVPIRGVQQATFQLRAKEFRITEGRNFTPGANEVIVGKKLPGRIQNCAVGDVITFNTTPFQVVGVFECPGPFESEVWGDLDRMVDALERYGPNRILAQLQPESFGDKRESDQLGYTTRLTGLAERLMNDPTVPAKVLTEREYMTSQTAALSTVLRFLGLFLGTIMGLAAVFTATNTMMTAIASRTHEIGILLATGFRPLAIFMSFLLEALVLCVLGGLVGCLLALPLNGVQTGTTNFQTFTEVAFGFRLTPLVLFSSVAFSMLLGIIGGALPAWRAARMTPTQALRRQ